MEHVTIIPSRERAEYFFKYKDLPVQRFNHQKFNTILWISDSDFYAYDNMIKELDLSNVSIFIDDRSTNISETRQNILEFCIKEGYKYLWMPDDDLRFYDRETNFKPLPMDVESNTKLFNHLISMSSNRFPMLAVRERFMINTCKYAYELNHKILCNYFIHVPTFHKESISFKYKDMKVYEDRIVQLLLNMKGYRILTTSMYAQSQRHEQNNAGGCSSYRSVEENMRCAKIVHEDFPEYTSLHRTKTWSKIEATFFMKRFLEKGELPYIPINEMEEWRNREGVYYV